ncbi:hypothetical protein K432DRAFT_427806 [Lepidopterella palustris CBS 459.81]|uniref:Peptidase S33 tripeptidyl aminopeptidase-like C-terminal domain-containing protein n=1 Tax=Lepidopterella palustris CBS 459.81 TaxID=1314670 RepID=A0A8E2JCM7_9PEZI|nr:hypothetical protein K432DRAFT_427806 [Lepidopterella palustris CBS 459.81]
MKSKFLHGEFGVPRRRKGRTVSTLTIAAIAILFYQFFLSIFGSGLNSFPWRLSKPSKWNSNTHSYVNSSTVFDWSSIKSSSRLNFKSCYGRNLQCAKLELPFDYWNGTNKDKTIALAVGKLPAKVPVTDPRYGGPILFNPGGPGGSGIGFIASAGQMLQTIVDSAEDPHTNVAENSTAKYYDILSFDPRGVGETSPAAICFYDASSGWSWMLRELTEGILGSSDAALGRLWSMNQALGSTCARTAEDGDDIKQFLTTASVARDMLELIEKHAEWKSHEAHRIIYTEAAERSRKSGLCRYPGIPSRFDYKPNEEKLQYWGFSYGSFLGNTFASMYPSRVSRVILDGVVDSDDYVQTRWTNNLDDTEKVMQTFYATCAALGPASCPLANTSTTPATIETRVQAIINSLYHNPLPVPGDTPEVITYSDARLLIFQSLYTPLLSFPLVAQILAAIERRDGTAFAHLLEPLHTYSCAHNSSDKLSSAAQYAILCSDGAEQTWMTADLFDNYWHELEQRSPTIGAIWARLRLRCTAWHIRPLYRFAGPFGAQTSHPILWIGNTADPVTPLASAKKMAERFPRSVVLTQDSAGHCSISSPSVCTLQHIRTYFHTGNLPAPDTICAAENTFTSAPHPHVHPTTLKEEGGDREEDEKKEITLVQEAHRGLQRMWAEGRWGLGKEIFGGRMDGVVSAFAERRRK